MIMSKKRVQKGGVYRKFKFNINAQNPFMWILAILFISTFGLAAMDLKAGNYITGAVVSDTSLNCETSDDCQLNYKCLANKCVKENAGSCNGYCGARAVEGCYCDNKCETLGDCCSDFSMTCT